MRRFYEHLFRKRSPELDWIQIEITSRCNGRCSYCPQYAYSADWQNGDLPLSVFRSLGPIFEKIPYIHLQGWGEPFSHPDFFDMLAFAKKRGCTVGTTTNGNLLSSESIERLVGERLDIIAFSLAGMNDANDRMRRGTSIEQVLHAIEKIHTAKAKHHAELPKIHIAYMLLRSGLGDLPKLPAFFAGTGADQVVISSLSMIVRPELEKESFAGLSKEEYLDVRRRLLQLKNESARLGVNVHFHIASPLVAGDICPENVGKTLVIGSDGRVSPCVMTNIPVRGVNFHYRNNEKRRLGHLSFGNIINEPLNEIWYSRAYRAFRRSFVEGPKREACMDCLKLCIDDLTNDEV